MKDEKQVSVPLNLAKRLAEYDGNDMVAHDQRKALSRLIAAQHPPEPAIPDADWLVGEDRADQTFIAAKRSGTNLWALFYSDGSRYTACREEMVAFSNLRALDLSALPGPGDEVVEGSLHYVHRRDVSGYAEGTSLDFQMGQAEGNRIPATLIIRKSKGGGDGR